MNIDFKELKIGDRIIRTKGGIFSKHHVIYAGFWNGGHLIAENQLGFGVRYITLEQFVGEGTIEKIEYYNYDENSQAEIINRINDKIGMQYSLLNYNCEHFVNDVLTNIVESKQIKTALAISIGVTLCYLAFKKNKEI
jgi:hypothetical protein